jgi:hypothetical protein
MSVEIPASEPAGNDVGLNTLKVTTDDQELPSTCECNDHETGALITAGLGTSQYTCSWTLAWYDPVQQGREEVVVV